MGRLPVSRPLTDRLRPAHLGWLAALLLLGLVAVGGGFVAALATVLVVAMLAIGLRRVRRTHEGQSARARALQRAFGKTRLTPARLPRISRPSAGEGAPELLRGPAPAETLESVLRMARDHLGAQEAVFFRITRERDALEAAAWAGDSEVAPTGLRPEWHGLIEWTAREQLSQCDNSDATPHFAAVPVPGSTVPLGALCVWDGGGLGQGREVVLQWLPRYAQTLGRMAELLEARHELVESKRRQHHVLDQVKRFQSTRSRGELEALVCQTSLEISGGERAALVRWNRGELRGEVVTSFGDEVAPQGLEVEPESLVGEVCRGGLPLVLGSARLMTSARRIFAQTDAGVAVESLGIYPLKNQNKETVGAIVVEAGTPGMVRYDAPRDLHLFSLYAAMSLETVWEIDEVSRRARTDQLTGLFNRRYFDEQFARMVAEHDRDRRQFSLLVVDIDHFKKFNDTYGHEAGDAVLRSVASAFRDGLRVVDICARYGGEEIAVLLHGTPLAGALDVAERLRRTIDARVVRHGGHELRVTASFGVACFPESASSGEALFPAADRALYQAKHEGRNCVRCAPSISSGKRS